jgi:hypothetical protein
MRRTLSINEARQQEESGKYDRELHFSKRAESWFKQASQGRKSQFKKTIRTV